MMVFRWLAPSTAPLPAAVNAASSYVVGYFMRQQCKQRAHSAQQPMRALGCVRLVLWPVPYQSQDRSQDHWLLSHIPTSQIMLPSKLIVCRRKPRGRAKAAAHLPRSLVAEDLRIPSVDITSGSLRTCIAQAAPGELIAPGQCCVKSTALPESYKLGGSLLCCAVASGSKVSATAGLL